MTEFGFLTPLGIWGTILFALIGLSLRVFWGINKDEGRGRWVAWLKHDGFARRYRELLDAGLNRIDGWLSPEFPPAPTDHRANRKTSRPGPGACDCSISACSWPSPIRCSRSY